MITIGDDFKNLPYVKLSEEFKDYKKNQISLIVCHGDEVIKPSVGIENLKIQGFSEYTDHEIITADRILTF